MIKLTKNELRNVIGGVAMAACKASCGSYSVTCNGASCSATDGSGCQASTVHADGSITHDDKYCSIA